MWSHPIGSEAADIPKNAYPSLSETSTTYLLCSPMMLLGMAIVKASSFIGLLPDIGSAGRSF